MESTETSPEVQTPVASNDSAPAPDTISVSQGEINTSPSQADLDREFSAFYEKPTASEDVEQTQEEATPEEPAVEETPVAEQPPTEPEEQEQSAEGEEQARVRLKGEDALIARIAKQKGISIADASDLYRGVPKTAPAAQIPGLDETPQPSSATVELQSQIDALAAEIEEAEKSEEDGGKGDYLTPEHNKKVRQLGKLETALEVAKLRESLDGQRKGEQQATVHQQAVQSSIAAAQKEYPSLTIAGSPLGATSNAVIAEWQADPARASRLSQPDAPVLVAAEAAYRTANGLFKTGKFPTLDLALASLKTAAPVAPAKVPPPPVSAPVPVLQPRRVTPPSGSRTQVNGAAKPSSFGAAVAAADTPEEADRLFEEAYGSGTPQPLGRR